MTNDDLKSILAKTIAKHGINPHLNHQFWIHMEIETGFRSSMCRHEGGRVTVYGGREPNGPFEAVTLLTPTDGEPRAYLGVPPVEAR